MACRSFLILRLTVIIITILSASATLQAGQADTGSGTRSASSNRLVTFNGTVKDAGGRPRQGIAGITFTLYAAQQGGEALWRESQTVETDAQGRYTVLLGATEKDGMQRIAPWNDKRAIQRRHGRRSIPWAESTRNLRHTDSCAGRRCPGQLCI